MVKACIKLLITGIILLIVGMIGVTVLVVNGYEDVFWLDVPTRSRERTAVEVSDNGYYYEDGGELSILDMKYADTVTKLDINVKAGCFFIMSGDNLSITGSNIQTECLDYKIEDGILYVSYSPEFYLMNWNFNFDDAQIIITVPPKVYETANFSVKAGTLHVGDFKVNRLYVDFSAGDSNFSNVSASEVSQIEMSAGDCVFDNCSFGNADIKMTAGTMNYCGCTINGRNSINMTAGSMYYSGGCKIMGQTSVGMTAGDLYMELLGRRSDYNISIDRTAGSVYIDGDYISDKEHSEHAHEKSEENVKNDLDIKVTAGELNVLFYE